MGRKPKKTDGPQPTPAELDILQILWANKEATVREVYEALADQWDVGYTTVLKMMQIMNEKGLVDRDTDQRSHVYRAAVSQPATQKRLLATLLDKAFGGSLEQLLVRAIEDKQTSKEELNALRALLNKHKPK